MKERPLILFTLIIQLAVGAFLFLGALNFQLALQAGADAASEIANPALLAIGPLVALGLLASFFHLGTPRNAYRALVNWRSSWLSREILFTLLFAGSGAIFTALQWYGIGTPGLRVVYGAFTGSLGLASIYSMARLYMLRTLPGWNDRSTMLSFFITTFLLGSLSASALLVVLPVLGGNSALPMSQRQALTKQALNEMTLVWFLLLGLMMISLPLSLSSPVHKSEMHHWRNRVLALRLALVFSGAGVLGWLIYQQTLSTGTGNGLGALTLFAFGLVLAGEILGRYLFYTMRPQPLSG